MIAITMFSCWVLLFTAPATIFGMWWDFHHKKELGTVTLGNLLLIVAANLVPIVNWLLAIFLICYLCGEVAVNIVVFKPKD